MKTGDEARVRELLKTHPWLKTASEERGETPLHVTAALGRQVLASMDFAGEWAVGLRRVALRVPPESNPG